MGATKGNSLLHSVQWLCVLWSVAGVWKVCPVSVCGVCCVLRLARLRSLLLLRCAARSVYIVCCFYGFRGSWGLRPCTPTHAFHIIILNSFLSFVRYSYSGQGGATYMAVVGWRASGVWRVAVEILPLRTNTPWEVVSATARRSSGWRGAAGLYA